MHDAFAGDHMTPRDLVCHCSGLPGHDFVWLNAACTRQELLERLQYLEPNKDFRAVYQYQNLMFMAPGCLVGQISQSSWEAFVQERILDPLGMVRTNLSVRTSQTSEDVALPYHEREGEVNEVPFRNIDAIGPAGSINSCVTDMAQWLVLNLNKGKHGDQQIISEGTLSEIHSPQMVIREALKHPELLHSSYGLGWIVQPYRGHRLIRHGGRIDGFSALTSFMPHDNIGVVALSNRDIAGTPLPTILTYQVYDRLLGLDLIPWSDRLKKEHDEAKEAAQKAKERAVAERKSGTGLTHPLADYIGDFEHPGYGVVSVEVADGGLKATFHDMAFPLEHYHYDIFEMVSDLFDTRMTVSFISDVKGEISRLSIPLEPSVKDIIFTRMQDKS
jgi:CubicO group peptidase (beta-lactamase class C family)